MKQLAIINPENISEEDANSFPTREASRAVLIDRDGKVALLHVKVGDYFKIPGGGIENGEDKIAGLRRECVEEAGCEIEMVREIGSIEEWRKMFSLKQISYCYLAKVVGEKDKPKFEQGEIEEGFELLWLDYEEAVEKISHCAATIFEASGYMVPRDTLFLREAKKYVQKH